MRMKAYRHNHNKEMKTPAVAQMAAIMLYNKRFFPYYISNILAGLDENGKGVLYSYDPVSCLSLVPSIFYQHSWIPDINKNCHRYPVGTGIVPVPTTYVLVPSSKIIFAATRSSLVRKLNIVSRF